jgi:hypothetical protein
LGIPNNRKSSRRKIDGFSIFSLEDSIRLEDTFFSLDLFRLNPLVMEKRDVSPSARCIDARRWGVVQRFSHGGGQEDGQGADRRQGAVAALL